MNDRISRQADEWLRAAEANMDIGFWTWSVAERRFTPSSGLCALLGVNPAATQIDPLFLETLVHPQDRLEVEDANTLALDDRQAHRRYRVIRPDGQLRWLESTATKIHDRDAHVVRVDAVVTEVGKAEVERRRGDRLHAMLQNASRLLHATFWAATEDGEIVDLINNSRYSAPGDKSDIGLNWRDTLHPDDVARIPKAFVEAIAARRPYRFDGRVMSTDGQYRAVQAAGLPFDRHHSSEPLWGGYAAIDRNFRLPSESAGEPVHIILNPGQVRACRALLNWTAETLAARAGISVSTVRRLEGTEVTQGQGDSMRLVMLAFREAGLKIWRADDGRFCVSDVS
jgi:PAS domain-containing protein